MALITCPECGSQFSEQQLKSATMCPSCGLPEAEVRKSIPTPPPVTSEPERAPKKDSDDSYKTTASKLLNVLAWLTWAGGAIWCLILASEAADMRNRYLYTQTTGDAMAFLCIAVLSSALVVGALFYAASRALVDLRAIRRNLEHLAREEKGEE